MSERTWEWLEELDGAEKAKALEVLSRHPKLQRSYEGAKEHGHFEMVEGRCVHSPCTDPACVPKRMPWQMLAWDGENLLAYERPPTQAYYFQDDDGKWCPAYQAMIDSGEVLDTKDGGFLMLVPVAK